MRVLVGARGLARWTPDGATVVLWDDLGTDWTCCPVLHGPGVELRRGDREVVVINSSIVGCEQVVARVAAELARRSERAARRRDLHAGSEAIRPDEPGIAEPRP